jgi:hypothetical protein
MVKCPYCEKEYTADMIQIEAPPPTDPRRFWVFTCPECKKVLSIVGGI